MPFGGLVVNRVHAAPKLDGGLPPELATELGADLAERVDESARELAALAARDEAGVERLLDALGDPPAIVVPELDDDVHDVDGLVLVREHLFADEGEAPRLGAAPRARRLGLPRRAARRRPGAARARGGRRGRRAASPAGSRRARRSAPRRPARAGRSPATAARSSEIALAHAAAPRRRGPRAAAQIAAIRSAMPLVAGLVGVGEQRAAGEQPVGQRLDRARALAAELEAPQRPRQLAGARRAAGDERAERAQRVLLLGGEQAVVLSGGGSRWRAARPTRRCRPCAPRRSGRARARRRPTGAARSAGGAAAGRRPRARGRRRARPRARARATVAISSSAEVAGRVAAACRRARARARRRARSSSDSITRPVDRREHDRQRAAVVGGRLQLGVGVVEALRVEARTRSPPTTPRSGTPAARRRPASGGPGPGVRRPRACR